MNLIKLMKVEEFFKNKFRLFNLDNKQIFKLQAQVLPKILVELSTLTFLIIFMLLSIVIKVL